MHPKAIWGSRIWFGLAVAALLPVTLCAQSSNDLPPQAGPRTGFPGWHGQIGKTVNPNPRARQTPPPPVVPTAKPSAAVPASQLPAMPVAVVPPPPPPPPPTPAQKPADRATVDYENGLVTVKANNSSLNQILRALMRQTGLKIDGGVTEERVYGVYGPASMQTLLATLLDGTDANILYLPAMNGQSATLTLTPRAGGSSPPPPTASASDDLLPPPTDTPAQMNGMQPNLTPPANAPTITVQSGTPPANPVAQAPAASAATPVPIPANPTVTAAPAVSVPAPSTTATTATAQPVLPNTGHTAEDIVQQILQMRAAQQKAAAQAQKPAPPAAPAPAATPPPAPAVTPQ